MSPPNPFLVRLKGMTTILLAGVAVIDFVFRLDTMPRAAEKYRATDAAIAAVAVRPMRRSPLRASGGEPVSPRASARTRLAT